jgi:hypothetical protein
MPMIINSIRRFERPGGEAAKQCRTSFIYWVLTALCFGFMWWTLMPGKDIRSRPLRYQQLLELHVSARN